jgi:hypothetical protein
MCFGYVARNVSWCILHCFNIVAIAIKQINWAFVLKPTHA